MHVLVFGAKGRLGKRIVEEFGAHGHKVSGVSREDLDLSYSPQIRGFVSEYNPDLVINCSAKNGLEQCVADPEEAFLLNTLAPLEMALGARDCQASFVHFSTDYACCSNKLTPSTGVPWGVYGISKYCGEQAILALRAPEHFIFRLSSIYDSADMCGSLDAIKQYRAGKGTVENPIKVLKQLTTPTSTRLIAHKMFEALEFVNKSKQPLGGLYNLVTWEPVWKDFFALKALSLYEAVSGANVRTGTLANPRPAYSVLSNKTFCETFELKLPTVLEDLENEYLLWAHDEV
jgi:dTDP-4-dehydrorhamnose reductase